MCHLCGSFVCFCVSPFSSISFFALWVFFFHASRDPNGFLSVFFSWCVRFMQLLFQRLEGQLFLSSPPSSRKEGEQQGQQEAGTKSPPPLLQHCFGGTLVNQIVREGGGGDDLRENAESFVCLSLDVKGCSSLENSLQKFVAGESFPDYAWDPAPAARVTITKRQCLLGAALPASLIFHLKRFEFNLDTFLREKVNDEFSFPIDTPLDVRPFTKEGLQQQQQGQDEGGCCYMYSLGAVVVHTGERVSETDWQTGMGNIVFIVVEPICSYLGLSL